MTATVTLTEAMLNQVGRALDNQQQADAATLLGLGELAPSPDREFAMETVREAIRDGIAARLAIVAAMEEPEEPTVLRFTDDGVLDPFAGDHPGEYPVGVSYHEWQSGVAG